MLHGVVVGSDIEASYKVESADTSYKLSDRPLDPTATFDVSAMGAEDMLDPLLEHVQGQGEKPSTLRTPSGKAMPIFVPEFHKPKPCVSLYLDWPVQLSTITGLYRLSACLLRCLTSASN